MGLISVSLSHGKRTLTNDVGLSCTIYCDVINVKFYDLFYQAFSCRIYKTFQLSQHDKIKVLSIQEYKIRGKKDEMKLKTLFRNLIPLKKMQAKTKLDHFRDGKKQTEREKITVKNDFVLNRATDEVIFFLWPNRKRKRKQCQNGVHEGKTT